MTKHESYTSPRVTKCIVLRLVTNLILSVYEKLIYRKKSELFLVKDMQTPQREQILLSKMLHVLKSMKNQFSDLQDSQFLRSGRSKFL